MARKKAKALPPKMITVYAEILQETEDAILVRCDDEADGVWLPKSQIEYAGERGDTHVEVQLPDWLADEKGFFDGMGYATSSSPADASMFAEANSANAPLSLQGATEPDSVGIVVPAEPEKPDTVTLYGSCNEENQMTYNDGSGVVFTVEYEDASIEFSVPQAQIVNLHIETPEEASITVSRAYAIEAGMIPPTEETADTRPAGAPLPTM